MNNNTKIRSSNTLYSSGFTMIELLVAVVIFSIGLIGIAGMQSTALKIVSDSQTNTRASMLATNIIEKIRLNPAAEQAGHYNTISGTQAAPDCITTTTGNTTTTDPSNIGSCTPQELAALDAWQWMNNLQNDLPSGDGSVALTNGTYLVTINWKELENGQQVDRTYTLRTFL